MPSPKPPPAPRPSRAPSASPAERAPSEAPARKKKPAPSVRLGRPRPKISGAEAPHTKLLMVNFRSGETICTHPAVEPLLGEGWHVQSAAPRVTPEGTKLLVVLTRFPPVGRPSLCR